MNRRSRRGWRWLVRLAVLLIAGGLIFAWLTRSPAWYAPPDIHNEQVARLAEKVEYNLVQQVHQIRPEAETWTRRVHDDQANAWLAGRLREWVINQGGTWPEDVGAPQVKFDQSTIEIALPVGNVATRRTIVASFSPEIVGGRLHVHLDRVAMGRLTLPGDPVAALLGRVNSAWPGLADQAQAGRMLEVLAGRESLPSEWELGDGRRIELVGLKLGEGTLEFTARTLPAARTVGERAAVAAP